MRALFSFTPLSFEENQEEFPIVDFSDREVETDAYYNIVERFRRPVELFLDSINYNCFYDDDCLLKDQKLKTSYLTLISQIQSALEKSHIHIKTYRDILLEIIEDNEILIQLEKLF